jgi:hypothetical protein
MESSKAPKIYFSISPQKNSKKSTPPTWGFFGVFPAPLGPLFDTPTPVDFFLVHRTKAIATATAAGHCWDLELREATIDNHTPEGWGCFSASGHWGLCSWGWGFAVRGGPPPPPPTARSWRSIFTSSERLHKQIVRRSQTSAVYGVSR